MSASRNPADGVGHYGNRDESASMLDLSEFAAIATTLGESRHSLQDSDNDSDSGSDQGDGHGEYKRREHNVCERRRRNNIRQGFESLQGSIPHATMKLSKMEILRTGISYIKKLNVEITEMEAEIAELRKLKETRA